MAAILGDAEHAKNWSLFATVLDTLLARPPRHVSISRLDDRGAKEDHIHPEKIRRLKRSLEQTGSFSVLNANEIEKVARTFRFTLDEQRLLLAAVIATALQSELTIWMTPQHARDVAEATLPAIEQALRDEESGGTTPYSRGKGAPMLTDSEQFEAQFEEALDAIDRGTFALYRARRASNPVDQEASVREAMTHFSYARSVMDGYKKTMQHDERWQLWQREAEAGLSGAQQLLPPGSHH